MKRDCARERRNRMDENPGFWPSLLLGAAVGMLFLTVSGDAACEERRRDGRF